MAEKNMAQQCDHRTVVVLAELAEPRIGPFHVTKTISAANEPSGAKMQAGEEELKAWMIEGLAGNGRSYAALLRALVPLLSAFYRRRIGDPDAVEDLVQETLIAVHTRRMSYDRDRPFTAWLYAIARYRMIDHFRKIRQTCPVEEIDAALSFEGFDDETLARVDVGKLLENLPEKQADAIRQTRIAGKSIADVARGTGIGVSDVKISIHRGLKALAARIRGGRL